MRPIFSSLGSDSLHPFTEAEVATGDERFPEDLGNISPSSSPASPCPFKAVADAANRPIAFFMDPSSVSVFHQADGSNGRADVDHDELRNNGSRSYAYDFGEPEGNNLGELPAFLIDDPVPMTMMGGFSVHDSDITNLILGDSYIGESAFAALYSETTDIGTALRSEKPEYAVPDYLQRPSLSNGSLYPGSTHSFEPCQRSLQEHRWPHGDRGRKEVPRHLRHAAFLHHHRAYLRVSGTVASSYVSQPLLTDRSSVFPKLEYRSIHETWIDGVRLYMNMFSNESDHSEYSAADSLIYETGGYQRMAYEPFISMNNALLDIFGDPT